MGQGVPAGRGTPGPEKFMTATPAELGKIPMVIEVADGETPKAALPSPGPAPAVGATPRQVYLSPTEPSRAPSTKIGKGMPKGPAKGRGKGKGKNKWGKSKGKGTRKGDEGGLSKEMAATRTLATGRVSQSPRQNIVGNLVVEQMLTQTRRRSQEAREKAKVKVRTA